jgi:hypothetical protein
VGSDWDHSIGDAVSRTILPLSGIEIDAAAENLSPPDLPELECECESCKRKWLPKVKRVKLQSLTPSFFYERAQDDGVFMSRALASSSAIRGQIFVLTDKGRVARKLESILIYRISEIDHQTLRRRPQIIIASPLLPSHEHSSVCSCGASYLSPGQR